MYEPCRLLEVSRGNQVPKIRLPQVSAEGCWSRRCMESIQEISHTITGIYIFVVFAFQNFQHCSVSHSFSFISSFHVTKQKLDLYHQRQVGSNITVGLHSVPVGVGESGFPYLTYQGFMLDHTFVRRARRKIDVMDSCFNCKHLCELKSYPWYYRERQIIQTQGILNCTAAASVKMNKTCKRIKMRNILGGCFLVISTKPGYFGRLLADNIKAESHSLGIKT